jgi:hypothetical protein
MVSGASDGQRVEVVGQDRPGGGSAGSVVAFEPRTAQAVRDEWQESLDENEPQTLLQEVARRLYALDWSTLQTTDPFAIVVVPDDVGDNIVEYVGVTMGAQEIADLLALE